MTIPEPSPVAPEDWRELADGPAPLLRSPLPGPRAVEVMEADRAVVTRAVSRIHPLVPSRAAGCVIEDVDGNRFIDACAGIAVAATGHCHPVVTAAVRDQAQRLLHWCASDWPVPAHVAVCRRLAASAPVRGGSPRVFLANSGTEAVECAVKAVRRATGRWAIIAFHGAFHGRTAGSLALTASRSSHRRGFGPPAPGVFHAPWGVPGAVETLLRHVVDPGDVAGVFVEPILGEGGYRIPPRGWLAELRRLCDEHGILLVADEVQTGVGRTGRMWALEHEGVEADVLVAGKGLASGLPLAATIMAPHVDDAWEGGAHGSTFGGNVVACAAALATLELVSGGLADRAADAGDRLVSELRSRLADHPRVREIRGRGLMVAIDTDAPATARHVVNAAFARGVVTLPCGPAAVRLSPPLVIDDERITTVARVVAGAVTAAGSAA